MIARVKRLQPLHVPKGDFMYIDDLATMVRSLIIVVVILAIVNLGSFFYLNNKISDLKSNIRNDLQSVGPEVEDRFTGIIESLNTRLSELEQNSR